MRRGEPFRILAVIPGAEQGEGFIFARRQVQMLRRFGAQVHTFFLSSRTHPAEIAREALRFRRTIRDFRPDVVHAHYGTVTGLFCATLSSCPVAITFRGTDLNPSSEFGWFRAAVSRLVSQIATPLAREIICVSAELRQRLWWGGRRACVIRSGVDTADFYPITRGEARQRLGWPNEPRIVLFNLGAAKAPNKRFDLVTEAVALVRQKLPSVRLVVMEGNVPGARVPLYINASDAVVMASDFEGSPNIVKEALACNVPVCTVRVGDVEEMLAGVRNCEIVERRSDSMAAALTRMLEHPQRSNGRDFLERYSAEALNRQVFEVLQRAATRVPVPLPGEH